VRNTERSGRSDRISTFANCFPARSRIVASVSGKSIIVPRIVSSAVPSKCAHGITFSDALYLCRQALLTPGVRQILIAKRVNFRDDASDRWTARFLSPASDFRMPARIFRLSSALRDMHLGSGQKESVSEEALRWESSVFRHGRYVA